MLNGTWSEGKAWWGVKEGAMDLVSMADDIPQDVKDKVEAAKAGLRDGSLHIWQGPVMANDGQQVLEAGQVADDGFLTSINFFVQGVEGKVPGSK